MSDPGTRRGAYIESEEHMHPSNRRDFLTLAVLGPAVLSGCTAREKVIGPAPAEGKAEAERADADLFMKAARLEESAIKVYKTAAGLPFIKSDAAVLGTAGRFMAQHGQHRDSLVQAAKQFGWTDLDPSKAPMPPIPKEILDAARPDAERKVAVLRFARALEMQAAKAYFHYVVRDLRTDFGRKTAADILPVEAQHVAIYDMLLAGAKPAPTSFFSEQV